MHITVGPGLDNAEKHDLFNGCSGKWMRGRSTDAPRCMETPGATVRFGIVSRQKAIYAAERGASPRMHLVYMCSIVKSVRCAVSYATEDVI
jgi:hypothetical protein